MAHETHNHGRVRPATVWSTSPTIPAVLWGLICFGLAYLFTIREDGSMAVLISAAGVTTLALAWWYRRDTRVGWYTVVVSVLFVAFVITTGASPK